MSFLFFRESFDEEKEPDNMVLSGKLPSVTVKEQLTEKIVDQILDKTEVDTMDDNDDVVMVDDGTISGIKRKQDEDFHEPPEKKLKSEL